MPFPNQHAAVVVAASKFDQKTFRTINIGDKNSGITAIVGRKKGEKTTTLHSYRFDKKKFTATQAKKWLKDHDIKVIEFEEASEKSSIDSSVDSSDFNQIPDNLEYKTFHIDIIETKTNEDEQLGVFYGAMATEHKDRGNDIIAPEAFDKTLKRYKKEKRNIKLFYQHNVFGLPIGIIPIKSVNKDGKNWNVKGELNLDTQYGREVYSLMKQGALSDLSIGFSIIDQEFKNDTRIIKELELWEVSVVSEPMNPKATINEIKGAATFKDLPLASRDRDWDADAAMARVRKLTDSKDNPSKSYRNAFFWFDEENADNFTAYKLPFADVINGKLTAIPRGIFASAAAMRGARGGVDLPSEDKARVISHIERYYKKMDLESPFKEDGKCNIQNCYPFTDLPFIGDQMSYPAVNDVLKTTTGTTTKIPMDLESYLSKNECIQNNKLCIEDVEHIKTREEFNEVLSKSGAFSRSACEFLASCFSPKNPKIDQSKSGIDSEDEPIKEDSDIENEINEELETTEISKAISNRVAIRKLDELLNFLNQIKDDYYDRTNNSKT